MHWIRAYLMFAYAAAGRWADARAQRALVVADRAANSPHFLQAIIHETFGPLDSAIVDAERMIENREPLYTFTDVSCDPMFDRLKLDERYVKRLRRTGVAVCAAKTSWPIGRDR